MPAAAFWLSWAFSLCVGVRIYAAIRCAALVAFLAALRACFRACFSLLLALLLCDMPVEAQILLVTAFCGVGGILYRVIFPRLVGALFWL